MLVSTQGQKRPRNSFLSKYVNNTYNVEDPTGVCSCLIEFIKRVEKKRQNARLAEHFISFFFAN